MLSRLLWAAKFNKRCISNLQPWPMLTNDNDGERESIAEQQNEASFLENVDRANYAMLADDALAFTFTFNTLFSLLKGCGKGTINPPSAATL